MKKTGIPSSTMPRPGKYSRLEYQKNYHYSLVARIYKKGITDTRKPYMAVEYQVVSYAK
jgi:hypothetical protein